MSFKKNQNGSNMNDESSVAYPTPKNKAEKEYKPVNINTGNAMYKGVTVSSLNNTNTHAIMNFGKVQSKIQHVKPSSVKSKASPVQYVLQTKAVVSKTTFISSKVQRKANLAIPEPTPKVYNRHSTALINDNANNVLIGLGELLEKFSDEIEFEVNKSLFEITGVVYFQNYGVNFVLTLFSENGKTRVEFRKRRGDSIDFQQFWDKMIKSMQKKFKVLEPKPNKNELQSFGGFGSMDLDYSLVELDSNLSPYTQQDVDNFDLNNMDKTMEEIYDGLQNYPKQNFSKIIVKNVKVVNAILMSLNHSDLDIVRLSLLIVKELAQNYANELLSFNVLPKIVSLLSHRTDLVKKYSVQLLNVLSNSNKKWTLKKDNMNMLQNELKECREKWSNVKFVTNDFINSSMFENISKKLIST